MNDDFKEHLVDSKKLILEKIDHIKCDNEITKDNDLAGKLNGIEESVNSIDMVEDFDVNDVLVEQIVRFSEIFNYEE